MYLNCKTYFSYRYGTLSCEKLVKEAVELGIQAMAITNINCTSDQWEFLEKCKENNIKPLLGVEIRNEDTFMYILIAKNIYGVKVINEFLSLHLQQKQPFPDQPELDKNIYVIYPLPLTYKLLNQNEFIAILPSEINRLVRNTIPQDKMVVRQPVTFKNKTGYNLHRLLRAIDKNIILSKQQSSEIATPDENFPAPSVLLNSFRQFPSIITNTLQLIESCDYVFDMKSDKNKKTFSHSLNDGKILLEKLAMEGMRYRFGNNNKTAEARVRKELDIINKLNFNSYFLITWDVIRYAQNRGFYHVGRGSGANSIVAFCLQITDVNPIDLDLYFERFLNPYRTSPPDFDIDFSWKDRDEVIDYIFKRYGKDQVALLGMYSTFKSSAVIRELGKVFGLPKAEIDALVNNPKAQFNEDKIQKQILYYGGLLQGFPNYLSIHPGGMLISEEPITQYTALELPPKGFATTQIDMFVAEEVGLYKLDILSQRGLGHIKDAIQIIKQNRSISIDIHDVEKFKKDKRVAAQIRNADTIGCFYIESPAMRQLLKKLRCDDYITLVAASSIIRPGVSQSGMMREYIYRFHNPEKFEYIHPKMKELLEETYGVMVYQEDVIKVAHHFAGLDMAEADILRRAMSGKYRGRKELDRIRDKFFINCKEREYPDEISMEVWRQIESFSGYSFSKAHSASFAVESYQSLYLKTYFPLEFMVAVINNFGGFYSTELYFHELKRSGGVLHLPCVNESDDLTNVTGKDVYIGFIHIQNLERNSIEAILDERSRHGRFISIQDFIERTRLGIEQINILIRIDALRFTGKNKKTLLWEANFIHKKSSAVAVVGNKLFDQPVQEFILPEFTIDPLEDAMDEIELLGFPLRDPFDMVDTDRSAFTPSSDFHLHVGKAVTVLGYYITQKPVRTVKGDYMFFGTFIDPNGDWIDSVHFPEPAGRYPLTGKGYYILYGKVIEEFGVYTVDVGGLKKVGLKS